MNEEITPTTPETPAPALPSFDDFKSALPENSRSLLDKAGVKDFESFDKDYSGLTSLIGKKGLIKPNEGATPQEMQDYTKQVFNEIGVPSDGKYEFNIPENFDTQNAITQEVLDNLASIGVEKGITPQAFSGIVEVMSSAITKMQEESSKMVGTESALKTEWKADFEANSKIAESFINKTMPEAKGLLALPMFKKFAHTLALKTGEDTFQTGKTDIATKSDLKNQAREKTAEAQALVKQGKYREAEAAQEAAREFLSRAM